MVYTTHEAAPQRSLTGVDIVELAAPDVPDMLYLTTIARPGPFAARTRELGTYLGVRRDGELIAMAGERLHPPGWSEISAVCTAPHARGHGYAACLVRELIDRIVARGEQPFLHVLDTNTTAITLYEQLGFRSRGTVVFRGYRIPNQPTAHD